MKYTAAHLALVVPTKDRPQKIANLLSSISRQKTLPGKIIIVDGGRPVKDIAKVFSGRLPLEYYQLQPPSLIGQRNLGLRKLNGTTPLIGFIDDDIVFEKNALSEMIRFWNTTSELTAAVSFNIVNVPKNKCHLLHSLFYLSDPLPGRVLRSGVTTTYHNLDWDTKTQWVCGGATVWKLETIRKFPPQRTIRSRWAVCEDLIYSYPIGKTLDFFLCSTARVRHEHDNDYVHHGRVYRYVGYNEVLWRLYFVKQNLDLSTFAWLLYAIGRSCDNMWFGLIHKDVNYLKKALGNMSGLCRGLWAMAVSKNLETLLDENTSH